MTGKAPICVICKHYNRKGVLSCKAFPEKIPDEILKEGNKHSKKLKGQKNDTVFEADKDYLKKLELKVEDFS